MRSAFQASCVWCYQSIARQLSQPIYLNELSKIAYGNKELSNDIAQFWLDGSLAISATEQIEFLKCLIFNGLSYSDELQKLTKEIMLESIVEASLDNKKSGYSLYAKTGWAAGSLNIGWDVGFIEKDEDILVFAMNMHLSDIKQAGLRKKIVMQALRTLDLLN